MVDAVIMVVTSSGPSRDLVPDIEDLEGVTEAHVVAGDYDVVVEATADTPSDIIGDVASRIRGMDGVDRTRTYVAIG